MQALTPPRRCVTPRALCRVVTLPRALCRSAPRLAHPRTSLRCCATQPGGPANSDEAGGASPKSLLSLARRSWGVAWCVPCCAPVCSTQRNARAKMQASAAPRVAPAAAGIRCSDVQPVRVYVAVLSAPLTLPAQAAAAVPVGEQTSARGRRARQEARPGVARRAIDGGIQRADSPRYRARFHLTAGSRKAERHLLLCRLRCRLVRIRR